MFSNRHLKLKMTPWNQWKSRIHIFRAFFFFFLGSFQEIKCNWIFKFFFFSSAYFLNVLILISYKHCYTGGSTISRFLQKKFSPHQRTLVVGFYIWIFLYKEEICIRANGWKGKKIAGRWTVISSSRHSKSFNVIFFWQ